MNNFLVGVAIAGFTLSALACDPNPCPAGMQGKVKIAVTYVPADNWKDFPTHVKAHLSFLKEQMRLGNIQYAGPFVNGERVEGGLTIYNLSAVEKVERLVQQDALIAKGVATAKVAQWLECALENW